MNLYLSRVCGLLSYGPCNEDSESLYHMKTRTKSFIIRLKADVNKLSNRIPDGDFKITEDCIKQLEETVENLNNENQLQIHETIKKICIDLIEVVHKNREKILNISSEITTINELLNTLYNT